MSKTKILCLGNEFIKEDSLAKKIASQLSKELDEGKFEFININDSFQLMEHIKDMGEDEKIILLDVVWNLKEPAILSIQDLKPESITNAHDFDAGFFLQLLAGENENLKKRIKIIGIPMEGSEEEIKEGVKRVLE